MTGQRRGGSGSAGFTHPDDGSGGAERGETTTRDDSRLSVPGGVVVGEGERPKKDEGYEDEDPDSSRGHRVS